MNQISKNEIEKIINRFNIKKYKIYPINTSGNIAYQIKSSQGVYFLRLSTSGHRSRSYKEIEAEIELLNYINKHKIPVCRPICDKKGKQIINYKKHNGYIREFVIGQAKMNPSSRNIYEFGKLLGRFHSAIEGYKTKNKRTHIFDVQTTRRHFNQDVGDIIKSGEKDSKLFINLYKKKYALLSFDKNLPKGTIHEDMGKRHILWKNNKIVQIIDFDRSYFGPIILDLGQAIRGWCFSNNWKVFNIAHFEALLRGYASQRKLAVGEKNSLISAITFAILERALSFALHHVYSKNKKETSASWKFAQESLSTQIDEIFNNGLIINNIVNKTYGQTKRIN